jgi:hypothetical protein
MSIFGNIGSAKTADSHREAQNAQKKQERFLCFLCPFVAAFITVL